MSDLIPLVSNQEIAQRLNAEIFTDDGGPYATKLALHWLLKELVDPSGLLVVREAGSGGGGGGVDATARADAAAAQATADAAQTSANNAQTTANNAQTVAAGVALNVAANTTRLDNLTAANVALADVGGNYTATDLEAALAEIASSLTGIAHTSITGVDLRSNGNPNEYVVEISWVDGDGNAQTTVDPTPITVSGATDLSYTAATRTLESSTGNDAVLPEVVSGGDSGLMTGADKAKLDGVEAGATADQTGAEIKTAYEAEADTNAFTDAEKTKLANINDLIDEDDMSSDVDDRAPTQQSVVAYVGSKGISWALAQNSDFTDHLNPTAPEFATAFGSATQGLLKVNLTGNLSDPAEVIYYKDPSGVIAKVYEASAAAETSRTFLSVNETGHGYAVGQPVRPTSLTTFVAAYAAEGKEGGGVVTSVADADNYVVTFGGVVEVPSHGFNIGETYWLPQTAGVAVDSPQSIQQAVFTVIDANYLQIHDRQAFISAEGPVPEPLVEQIFTLSSNSPTLTTSGDILFDTEVMNAVGAISLNAGGIEVKADTKVRLVAEVAVGGLDDFIRYRWHDGTSYVGVGGEASSYSPSAESDTSAYAIITPTVDTVYHLKCLAVSGNPTAKAAYTKAIAEQLPHSTLVDPEGLTPEPLARGFIELSANQNYTSSYSNVGNLTLNLPGAGTYLISSTISHHYDVNALPNFVRLALDGVGVSGTEITLGDTDVPTGNWQGTSSLERVVTITDPAVLTLQSRGATAGANGILSSVEGNTSLSYRQLPEATLVLPGSLEVEDVRVQIGSGTGGYVAANTITSILDGGLTWGQVKNLYEKIEIVWAAQDPGPNGDNRQVTTVDVAQLVNNTAFVFYFNGSFFAYMNLGSLTTAGGPVVTSLGGYTGFEVVAVYGLLGQKTVIPEEVVNVNISGAQDGDLFQWDSASQRLVPQSITEELTTASVAATLTQTSGATWSVVGTYNVPGGEVHLRNAQYTQIGKLRTYSIEFRIDTDGQVSFGVNGAQDVYDVYVSASAGGFNETATGKTGVNEVSFDRVNDVNDDMTVFVRFTAKMA